MRRRSRRAARPPRRGGRGSRTGRRRPARPRRIRGRGRRTAKAAVVKAMRSRPGSRPDLLGERPRRRRQPVGIAGLRLAGDVEQHGAVAHRAGDGVHHRKPAPALVLRRVGDAALGRLQAEQAAARGRGADRAAAVAGVGRRHDPGRHRRRRAAGGAAGRAAEVPGIAARAEQDRLGDRLQAEFRRVGLAEDHQAGAAVQAGQRAVGLGDVVLRRAARRWWWPCPPASAQGPSADRARRPAGPAGTLAATSARARSDRSMVTALSFGLTLAIRASAASSTSAARDLAPGDQVREADGVVGQHSLRSASPSPLAFQFTAAKEHR